jgi:hypothetical protein
MRPEQLTFKKAEQYGLDIHIETSASDKKTLMGYPLRRATGATSVDFIRVMKGI